jgi:DNA-binding NarL/FixJ family response regulator
VVQACYHVFLTYVNGKENIMKVLILDGSKIMRKRLVAILSNLPEIEVVGEAEDPLKTIRRIAEIKPDAVILDFRNQRIRGIDLLRNIKKNQPAPFVLMLTSKFYQEHVRSYIQDKADLFLDKFTELDRLGPASENLTGPVRQAAY